MSPKIAFYSFLCPFLCVFLLSSCGRDATHDIDSEERYTIVGRISQEPDALFPLYTSSGNANRVIRLMYQSLMDVDPTSMELVPILAIAEPEVENSGDTVSYRFQIREEAAWPDGVRVTTEDVAFTIKVALVPGLDKSGIHTYLSNLVKLDYTSDISFTAFFKGQPFLSEEVISTLFILPRHIYDSENILHRYSVDSLKTMDAADTVLDGYKNMLDSMIYFQEVYVGSNAYALKSWTKQQGISLQRYENWWADKVKGKMSFFVAKPATINFAIIPDDGTALTAFKNKQIDVLIDVNARDFKAMKKSSDKYNFYETTPLSFYYLCLNNSDKLLKDKALRQALSLCFDVDKFIYNHMDSMGVKVRGPIHPSSPYFLETEGSGEMDLTEAKAILYRNGYRERNGKMEDRNGERVKLEMLISDGLLGKTMALLLKDNAAKIGIEISISTMKFSEIRKRLVTKDYQITPLSLSTNPFRYDPYQSWHSDNAGVRGSNFSGFADSLADSFIEVIRTAATDEERINAYKGFQQRIISEVPVIFIAAPVRCVMTQKDIDIPITPLNYSCDFMQAVKMNTRK